MVPSQRQFLATILSNLAMQSEIINTLPLLGVLDTRLCDTTLSVACVRPWSFPSTTVNSTNLLVTNHHYINCNIDESGVKQPWYILIGLSASYSITSYHLDRLPSIAMLTPKQPCVIRLSVTWEIGGSLHRLRCQDVILMNTYILSIAAPRQESCNIELYPCGEQSCKSCLQVNNKP